MQLYPIGLKHVETSFPYIPHEWTLRCFILAKDMDILICIFPFTWKAKELQVEFLTVKMS